MSSTPIKSTHINAFYDQGPAPPPIPLLSAQIPLLYDPPLVSMPAHEELSRPTRGPVNSRDGTPRHSRTTTPRHSRAPTPHHSRAPTPHHSRATTPIPHRPITPVTDRATHRGDRYRSETLPRQTRSRHSSPPEDDSISLSSHSSESERSDLSSDDAESSAETIPKPRGGAGRPESGGYNLAAAMKWDVTTFKALQDRAHELIEKHLDSNMSYSRQADRAKQKVRDALLVDFPDLGKFSGHWPANDLMQLRLKALTAKLRKQNRLQAAALVLGK